MLFRPLLLAATYALSAVVAIPNGRPGKGLEIRSEFARDGMLLKRADCPPGSRSDATAGCVCDDGALYDAADNTCSCGDSATTTWTAPVAPATRYKCGCKGDFANLAWDKTTSKCACPPGKKITGTTGVRTCKLDCGSQAAQGASVNSQGCDCTADGAVFNYDTKLCSCGSQASLNSAGTECKCKVDATTYDPLTQTCFCTDTTKVISNGKCGIDCGQNADVSATDATQCVCKAPGATFTSPLCRCGDDAALNSAGTACVCTDKTANWDADGKKCVCPKGQTLVRGGCVTDCGTDAKPDKTGKCICTVKGAFYSASTKSCTCSPDARLPTNTDSPNDQCVCKDKTATWDVTTSTCKCPANKKLVNSICVSDCGDYAKADDNGNCVCNDDVATWKETPTRGCTCPNTLVFVKGKCVQDCGDNATDNGSGTCVCNAPGATYSSTSAGKTCSCGTTADLNSDGSACVCKASTATWDSTKKACVCPSGSVLTGNTCTLDCGDDATLTGSNCVCKAPGATFNSKTTTCSCGTEAKIVDDECVCTASTATWDSTKKVCYCPAGFVYNSKAKSCDCPSGYKNSGGKCVLDCGDGTQARAVSGKCACYATKASFSTSTKTCTCPSAYILSTNGKRCDACPKGYVAKNNKCVKA